MTIRSVTQLTQYIKALIDGNEALADLWVEGEISNLTRASSGHCYFTLKDDGSELRCVMWRTQACRLTWQPAPGDHVEAHGYVSVYERGGVYQFYADTLERGGIGARWRDLQALKDRLQAEGLFDEARKRPLPAWPKVIGVVTSPVGAAFQDILKVLRARYPLVQVVLAPSLVQGEEAPASLVRAIEQLNQLTEIDVLLIARGGGSFEDLWAFNDERVARAIAASRVPVVSGIGHEIDFTIADFVADFRAPTPTAAALAVVPDQQALRAELQERVQHLAALVGERIAEWQAGLEQVKRRLRIQDPRRVLAEHRQRLDEGLRHAKRAAQHVITLKRMNLARCRASLQALNPSLVLARGYAAIQDKHSGLKIRSIAQVALGKELTIYVHDGRLGARVTELAGAQPSTQNPLPNGLES